MTDRRSFLKLLGGATGAITVASTMAEAEALAEFLSWLKRAPAWSFPAKLPAKGYGFPDAAVLDFFAKRFAKRFANWYFQPSPIFLRLTQTYRGPLELPPSKPPGELTT
jgi:hypothetical protein